MSFFGDFFGGMGGGDFFGGGMPGGSRGQVDNDAYYEILGVSKSDSSPDIARAYKKLALKNHPDRGGDPKIF